jgi:hypothetical protein
MNDYRMVSTLRVSLLLFALFSLTGCGMFEIRVEVPGEGKADFLTESALAPELASPHLGEMTPTPTSEDQAPPIPGSAFSPAPVGEYPIPNGLRVAYGKDDQVWLWTAETGAVALASTSRTNGGVMISNDGAVVAFLRGNEWWAVDRDGINERRLLGEGAFAALEPTDPGVTLHRLEWIPGTHTLAFNTRLRTQIGMALNHDLHLVDADTLEQTHLLPPGEGGEFYYAPDGSQIAIVTPGEISLVDADGGNRRDGVLTYTPVNTGSEYRFYARPAWKGDGSALKVAIPPTEPRALPIQPTTIWHIPIDGRPASLVTTVEAAPLLDPDGIAFSSDLGYVAYAQLRQPEGAAPEEADIWLEVRRLANDGRQAYPDVSAFYGWAPASQRFAFQSGREVSQLWIGQWSGRMVPGATEAGVPVYGVRWVDDEHYLFLARHNAQLGAERDQWDLVLADTDGSRTILASMDGYPHFDVTLVPSIAQEAPSDAPHAVKPTPASSSPRPIAPTPTPIAPLLGLIYRDGDKLWTNVGPRQMLIADHAEARISPHGNQILYVEKDGDDRDIWLGDRATGQQKNLTQTPDWVEDTPRWWPARPDAVIFASHPQGRPLGIGSIGYLTTVGRDGGGYRVLDDRVCLNSPPAPSPDGQTIAYGSDHGAWLYRWESGPELFDPAELSLLGAEEIEIASPSWSSDGSRLAWVLAGNLAGDGIFRYGVAVFDLEARTVKVVHSHRTGGGDGWPPAPLWSPNGQWLAFEAWAPPDEAGVWVIPADGQGGQARHLGGSHPAWSPDGRWLALSGAAPGNPGQWLVVVGTWSFHLLDLPSGAQIVDWIRPFGN